MAASAFGYPAMLRTLSLVLILMEALQTTQGVFTEESARRIVGNLATGWSASLTITAPIPLNVTKTAPISAGLADDSNAINNSDETSVMETINPKSLHSAGSTVADMEPLQCGIRGSGPKA